jgi:hypothetical protein
MEDKYIGSYDPCDGANGELTAGSMHLNPASIAKVCYTDLMSLDLVVKEILAQLKDHIKKGANLRVLFKVGKLVSKGGQLTFKSLGESNGDTHSRTFSTMSPYTRADNPIKNAMSSRKSTDNHSVMTPSIGPGKLRSMSS